MAILDLISLVHYPCTIVSIETNDYIGLIKSLITSWNWSSGSL